MALLAVSDPFEESVKRLKEVSGLAVRSAEELLRFRERTESEAETFGLLLEQPARIRGWRWIMAYTL